MADCFEAQRLAILTQSAPRRSRLPNRLDPFDCTLCAAHLHCLLARLRSRLLELLCRADVATQEVVIGQLRIGVLERRGAYATRLWQSSITLSRWLASCTELLHEKTVLEVGAGTGLCSLFLARATSARVLASDTSEAGLALLRQSAASQSLHVHTLRFDICSEDSLPQCDWMVASDLLYTPQLARSLARRCLEMVGRGGHAVVADPGRPTRRVFQAVLEEQGMRAAFVLPAEHPKCISASSTQLVLLHIENERHVSMFETCPEVVEG
ncbi:hypothetical protein AB1Y20_019940 [Prymnesium parvum]|uniref:Calmodulin-lysine N-methyltransferase n=1 Tax=Prymnesium parvum TaxID=97485 RepID=A0AB34JVG7_PRYPA